MNNLNHFHVHHHNRNKCHLRIFLYIMVLYAYKKHFVKNNSTIIYINNTYLKINKQSTELKDNEKIEVKINDTNF